MAKNRRQRQRDRVIKAASQRIIPSTSQQLITALIAAAASLALQTAQGSVRPEGVQSPVTGNNHGTEQRGTERSLTQRITFPLNVTERPKTSLPHSDHIPKTFEERLTFPDRK